MTELHYACGTPTLSGKIRSTIDDFQVDEVLGFEPDGGGEHVCLFIRKRNTNTAFLAEQLAKFAGVRLMDVSYAGLKDRHAVTTQWFSLYLSNKSEPDWQQLNNENIEILKVTRYHRKLRRGTLQGNQFTLVIRELQGDADDLEQRLQTIAAQGIPNYFGEQRFGYENLDKAKAMFCGEIKVRNRDKRSIYLSAARSQIFNHLLSQRVADGSWKQGLDGEVMQLAGSNAVFTSEQLDDTLKQRLAEFDIHPSGPLWGKGELRSQAAALALEQPLAEQFPEFCQGLAAAGLKQERRALRLMVKDLSWQHQEDTLHLNFFLPAGCYATVVLRELVTVK